MKRTRWLMSCLIPVFVLTACGSGTSSRNSFVLTPETKLALGTMKLEGTPEAVDAATAAKLLPLWQLLQQLSSSTSAAPQEVTAVLDQIRATMTASQISSINRMQFTPADFQTAFQQARGSGSTGAPGAGSSTGSRPTGGNGGGQGFFFGGGGAPAGGFGGGGGAPAGGFGGGTNRTGGTGTPATSQGSTSARSSQSSTARLSGFLVVEVIRLLESKLASS